MSCVFNRSYFSMKLIQTGHLTQIHLFSGFISPLGRCSFFDKVKVRQVWKKAGACSPQASWSLLHRSLSSSRLGSNFLFQGDLTIIPFYPWPGLGLEYKDRYPVEWTGLEGQQHPTHSTLLNAFYLKKLIRQQRCYLLLKERSPLGHTHTIILWWETAALAKHCCRADRHHWTLVRDYLRFLCHRR